MRDMQAFGLVTCVLVVQSVAATCKYERSNVIECLRHHSDQYDTNHDGKLSRGELATLFDRKLSWFQRSLAKSLGGVDHAMAACDKNQDGVIAFEEIDASPNCLTGCFLLEQMGSMLHCD